MVVLVTVGALGGFWVESTARGPVSQTSPCFASVGTRTYYDLPNGSRMIEVYQVLPGSTAAVCITYSFDRPGSLSPSAFSLLCGPYRAENRSIVWSCPGQVSVTPASGTVNYSAGAYVTIAYTLQAPKSDDGVYWFGMTCGDSFPVVVGALPPSIVFPIMTTCLTNPYAPSSAAVEGVSNMGIAMVIVG